MRGLLIIIAAMLFAAPTMADTYGTTTNTGTGATNGDFTVYRYAIPFTVGASDQIADTGFGYANYYYATTQVQMAIYEVAGTDTTIVDTTEHRSFGITDDRQWNAFEFQNGATLSAGTTYLLTIHGNGDAVIQRWDSTGFSRLYSNESDFTAWDSTWTGATTVSDMTLPLHVNTHAAGGAPAEELPARRREILIGYNDLITGDLWFYLGDSINGYRDTAFIAIEQREDQQDFFLTCWVSRAGVHRFTWQSFPFARQVDSLPYDPLIGDVNRSGEVDITDLTGLIDGMFINPVF